MLQIDSYAYSNYLAEVHPAEKLLFAVLTLMVCLAADCNIVSISVLFLMSGACIYKAGIPLGYYLRLLLIPMSFALVGILPIAIKFAKAPEQLTWCFQFWGDYAGVSQQSIYDAVKLLLRSAGSVTCLFFLSLTTPQVEILWVLRKLHLPQTVIELMSLVYRFLFVLLETASRIYISQSARLGYSTISRSYRSTGLLGASLLVRSLIRAKDLHTALEARGYSGTLQVLEKEYVRSNKNLSIIVLVEIALIIMSFIARS